MDANTNGYFGLPDYHEDIDIWCWGCGSELTDDDVEQAYEDELCIHCS